MVLGKWSPAGCHLLPVSGGILARDLRARRCCREFLELVLAILSGESIF